MRKILGLVVLGIFCFSFVFAGTDSFVIEKATNKLNYGEKLSDVWSTKITDNELPNFLKDSKIAGYDYTQKISLGTNLLLQNFSDRDYNNGEETLGIRIPSGQDILEYLVEFPTYVPLDEMTGERFYFLGKQYEVVDVIKTPEINITLEDSDGNRLSVINSDELELNGDNVNDVDAEVSLEGDELRKISITWEANDELFLTQENDIWLEDLMTIGFSFDDWYDLDGEMVADISIKGDYEEEQQESKNIITSCIDYDQDEYGNELSKYVNGILYFSYTYKGIPGDSSPSDSCLFGESLQEGDCDYLYETDNSHKSIDCDYGCFEGVCRINNDSESECIDEVCQLYEGSNLELNDITIETKEIYYLQGSSTSPEEKELTLKILGEQVSLEEDKEWENDYIKLKVLNILGPGDDKLAVVEYHKLDDYEGETTNEDNTDDQETNNTQGNLGNQGNASGCDGCELNNICYPVNTRENGSYCSIDKEWVVQKDKEESCENNFECRSNLCINDECVSGSLWAKFMRWLARVFG